MYITIIIFLLKILFSVTPGLFFLRLRFKKNKLGILNLLISWIMTLVFQVIVEGLTMALVMRYKFIAIERVFNPQYIIFSYLAPAFVIAFYWYRMRCEKLKASREKFNFTEKAKIIFYPILLGVIFNACVMTTAVLSFKHLRSKIIKKRANIKKYREDNLNTEGKFKPTQKSIPSDTD